MSRWFRHFLPVVVDLETGGVDAQQHPILEIACVALSWQDGQCRVGETFHAHVLPHEGATCDPASLAITGIIPDHPFRYAVPEATMLSDLEAWLAPKLAAYRSHKAILVGHNAHFDLGFLNEAYARCEQPSVFHRFSVLDTVTLGMSVYGESVLAKCAHKAGLAFDEHAAHAALYDAQVTADLFCHLVNQIRKK